MIKTVGELIKELEKFPENLDVVDGTYFPIEGVYEDILTDSNYPYTRSDRQVVVIN